MPIFQFAANACYSGSYGDHIMSGTLIQQVGVREALLLGNRREIGSHMSGVRGGLISQSVDFGDYLYYMSSSASRPENHSPKLLQAFSGKNQYYDSFVPDIGEVMETDCKGISLFGTTTTEVYPNYSLFFGCMFGTYGNGRVLGITASIYNNSFSDGAAITNDFWLTSFPFSPRYSNVKRLQTFSNKNLTYRSSCSFHNRVLGERPWAGYSKTQKSDTTFDPQPFDLFWLTDELHALSVPERGITVCYVGPNTMKVSPYVAPGDVPNNSAACSMRNATILGNIAGVVSGSNFLANPQPRGYPPDYWLQRISISRARVGLPSSNEIIKRLYGFGDGVSNIPDFISTISSSWHGMDRNITSDIPGVMIRYGTVIRGWKYGLLSGFPIVQKAIYNRNHFGFLRDLIEGPYSSKITNLETNFFSTPVNISFIAGTDDYLAAASPNIYNLNSSGIYDREYTSGKPFADI